MFEDFKFWRMGTKHESYVRRIEKDFAKVKSFYESPTDKQHLTLVDEQTDKVITSFSSPATLKQFLITGFALGFFDDVNGKYVVKSHEFDYEKVTDAIFDASTNRQVKAYRETRIACVLSALNLLHFATDPKKIKTMRRGKGFSEGAVAGESSLWEQECLADLGRISDFLRRLQKCL